MMTRRHVRWVVGGFLVLALLGSAACNLGAARLAYSAFSPQGVYRIDTYRASWLNSWWSDRKRWPGFVRLYRVNPPQLLGESAVVDLNDNGRVFWEMAIYGKVSVGMDITFDNVPPECNSHCVTPSPKNSGATRP